MIKSFYSKVVFKHPFKIMTFVVVLVAILGFFATRLEIDASSDTLLLDNDKDLLFTQEISKKYTSPNFLILTYSPKQDLLAKQTLTNIQDLSHKLEQLEQITSITSILNVPLFQSPVLSLKELTNGIQTLQSTNTNKELAQQEFLNSPLYQENLVSSDFKTTAILLNLKNNIKLELLNSKKQNLIFKQNKTGLDSKETQALKNVKNDIKKRRDIQREIDHNTISQIRTIIKDDKSSSQIFLGGINMIANDVVSYVRADLSIYGSILIMLFILILWFFFKQKRWVVLPLFICLLSVVSTTGVLGLFSWEVTVISSNFISLQLIITISIVLHLIVRYRELIVKYPKASQHKLVLNTMLSKLNPSFFAIITTIVGFASLILSDIKPVINLGWMMSFGIAISLLLAFLVFPALLILLKKKKLPLENKSRFSLVQFCAKIVEKRGVSIITGSVVLAIFSFTGASQLIVENSFINYFKSNTEIYKGMKIIDEKLGGTTPLDIIITFNQEPIEQESKTSDEVLEEDEFDSFDDEFDAPSNDEQYWFTPQKMNLIMKVHNYLEGIDEIGNVSSFATLLKIGNSLNNNEDLDSFKLALLYNELPLEYKDLILTPFINIESNQVRLSVRIIDSNEDLRRNELIKKLNRELSEIIDPKIASFRLSNLMILYNNMLQSLFDSQILTLGVVALVLFIMFLILFRSLSIAFIAIISNIIPIGVIFGLMGWFGIPLDLMTITIAAISIGIGVDDTIHYIHRYKEEFHFDRDYILTMRRTHNSIGYAMFYTSFAVVVGFSILIFSNFIPTIYFGLLTMLVMIVVLLSALLLLPKLLIVFKPFDKRLAK